MNVMENRYEKSIIKKLIPNSPTEQCLSWLKFIGFVELFSCFILVVPWLDSRPSNVPGKCSTPPLYASQLGYFLVCFGDFMFPPLGPGRLGTILTRLCHFGLVSKHLWWLLIIHLTGSRIIKETSHFSLWSACWKPSVGIFGALAWPDQPKSWGSPRGRENHSKAVAPKLPWSQWRALDALSMVLSGQG